MVLEKVRSHHGSDGNVERPQRSMTSPGRAPALREAQPHAFRTGALLPWEQRSGLGAPPALSAPTTRVQKRPPGGTKGAPRRLAGRRFAKMSARAGALLLRAYEGVVRWHSFQFGQVRRLRLRPAGAWLIQRWMTPLRICPVKALKSASVAG